MVRAVIELANRIRKFITDLIAAAIALVNKLANMLKQVISDLLNAIGKLLSRLLEILRKALLDVVKAVMDAIKTVLEYASKLLAALGDFMLIAVDFLSDPGGWLSGAKNSAVDGAKNHLFAEVKAAVKEWFQSKIEEILGIPKAIIDKLIKGGYTLEKIVKETWDAIVPSLPFIIGEIVITKVVAKLIPGAGWVMAVIDAIRVAIGALGEILRAIGAVITWLKAVRQGGAGVLFAKAVAAGIVALLELAYEALLSGIGKYIGKVGRRLRGVAAKLGKKKDKPGDKKDAGGDGSDPKKNTDKDKDGDKKDQDRPGTPKPTTKTSDTPGSTRPTTTKPKPDTSKPDTKPSTKPDGKPPTKPDTTPGTKPSKPDGKPDQKKETDKPGPKPDTGKPDQKKDQDRTPSTPDKPKGPSDRDGDSTRPRGTDTDTQPKPDKDDDKPATSPTPTTKPKPKDETPDKPRTDKDDDTTPPKDKDRDSPARPRDRDRTPDKDDDRDGPGRPKSEKDKDRRQEEENSDSAKNARLALIAAEIRRILKERLDRGIDEDNHKALMAVLRHRYKLTALHKTGGERFTVIARLNPSIPVIPGYHTYETDIDHTKPDPPPPKPHAPSKQNNVLATNFTAEGINEAWAEKRGEKANKARKDEPIGFRHINKYDLNADASNYWVRQHLLTELLGGTADGRNLVPARNRVNQNFKNEVEIPAEQWIRAGKNKFAWYDVKLNYHPGKPEGFPSFLRTEWGAYYPDYVKNEWVKEKRGRDYNENSNLELPPGPGDRVYVNHDSAVRMQTMLGIPKGIAEDIEDVAEANNNNIPGMSVLLEDLKTIGRIKRRRKKSWGNNVRKLLRAATEGRLTFDKKP